MSQGSPWDEDAAAAIIQREAAREGAMLPLLHALQAHFGYIDAAAIPMMADALNLSRAEVHGVLTFYHDFRTKPEPRRIIKLCRAEACQALGCEALVHHAAEHGVTPEGKGAVKLETVYCLGLCAQGPAALVEGEVIARLDARKLSALIEGAAPADILAEALAGEGVG